MVTIPRLVVGACQGRSGKTTFTLGLLKALQSKGLEVQPFKKGPDYIDPSWMTYASGQPCRNLDAFMMSREEVEHTFIKHALNKDIAVIEGAMGLFDGLDVEGSNSTAQIAYIIDAPVILVVNCQRITRSVAALVNGVVDFDPRITIGGVILNNVARPRHQNIMIESIKRYCKVPVIGTLPKSKDIEIPDRHLGLIPAGEQDQLQERVEKLGQLVLDNVDLDQLLTIARATKPVKEVINPIKAVAKDGGPTIGVIKDRTFSFYYPENLEALEENGAKLVMIDSVENKNLPKIEGLYIGGGFPELMAEDLSKNQSLREQIKNEIEKGLPVYAEGGGLMYLTQSITVNEKEYPMVGAFPCRIQMENKPQGHGYTIQKTTKDHPFLAPGTIIKGHEFHNSRIVNLDEKQSSFAFETQRGKGISKGFDGLVYKNTLACFNHLHASSADQWAPAMVKKAIQYGQGEN